MFHSITEEKMIQNWESTPTFPIVSIICITYNHEKYISQALESFLMQETSFPFEILIGEDCSTDNTLHIIQQYKKKYPNLIKIISNKKNVGAGKNFTRVYESTRSKYIALCEGDDYWTDPLKLQKQIDFLEKHPDYAISCHNCDIFDNETNRVLGSYPNLLKEKEMTIDDLLKSNIAHTCSFIYRNVDIKIPSFFEKLTLGDWPLHMLHAQYGKIKFFPENMAIYRIHSGGIWSSSNMLKRLDETILTLKYMNKYFKNQYSLQINKTISNFLLAKAHYHLEVHNTFLSTRCYMYAQKYNKISFSSKTNYMLKRHLSKVHPWIIFFYTKIIKLWKNRWFIR